MNGLLYLTGDDFSVSQGTKGKILTHSIKKGYSLVLFYSNQCSHCQTLIPIFKKLPDIVNGCYFALVNISQNKDVIDKSKVCVAPITYVPFIVMYINGNPYIKYNGPANIEEIKRFILEVVNSVDKQKFSANNNESKTAPPKLPESNIPAYTTGKPVCAGDVCYLTSDAAYTK